MGRSSVLLIVDAAPSLTIFTPLTGATFEPGDAINFTANADDAEEGDLGAAVAWASDVDGPLGEGSPLAVSALTSGSHAITATVTDRDGRSANATISVIVNGTPTVGITEPAAGSLFAPGDLVTFTGTASDHEDDDLASTIHWSSDRDGDLGIGRTIIPTLVHSGTHTITATVTDSGGRTASATVTLEVD